MREILFRGRRIGNDEWVEGNLLGKELILPHGKTLYKSPENHLVAINVLMYAVDPATVGQYTGLNDSTKWEQLTEKEQSDWLKSHTVDEWNGRRIFEGDVCRFREWSKGEMCWVGKVHWEHQQFVISGSPNKECDTPFALPLSRFVPKDIEVIGNIHDNPEMMKEG